MLNVHAQVHVRLFILQWPRVYLVGSVRNVNNYNNAYCYKVRADREVQMCI